MLDMGGPVPVALPFLCDELYGGEPMIRSFFTAVLMLMLISLSVSSAGADELVLDNGDT